MQAKSVQHSVSSLRARASRVRRTARWLALLAAAPLLASCGGESSGIPEIPAIMNKPRYVSSGAAWSMAIVDVDSGATVYSLNPDALSYTGSVRKLFSVGAALDKLGADHRFTTAVYRDGAISASGALAGNLILRAAGDLTFGGRMKGDGSLDFTPYDHNEARGFGGAALTPEDPLAAVDDLARQIRASGIRSVGGDVVVDDRLFEPFRVPNGNVLISPILINENVIDLTVTPAIAAGQPAQIDWRPKTRAYTVAGSALTSQADTAPDIAFSGDAANAGALGCLSRIGCAATVSGTQDRQAAATLPAGYQAPLIGNAQFVSIVHIDDPASFARTALVDALARNGVSVGTPAVASNPAGLLPSPAQYASLPQVASFASPPYAEIAKLILKVSLNTGANLSLMHLGLTRGARTVADALSVERGVLTAEYGLDPGGFDFPTNGSGSPDSRATARTTARLLQTMSRKVVYPSYRDAMPILGTDGSLADVGKDVEGKEHIYVKSGATLSNGKMVALTNAGYMRAKSGRILAFAVFVNNAGPLSSLSDALGVFEDEAQILGVVYRRF
ncbi:hypothetical protein WS99_17835 [Burkholderia territorii]|nr:hypothetical protein WS99_17835 [Burkholderia territorii]KWH07580.1 hypothetical protein WT58_15955 [Burkholderia territorii]